jgi:hypothetical protein
MCHAVRAAALAASILSAHRARVPGVCVGLIPRRFHCGSCRGPVEGQCTPAGHEATRVNSQSVCSSYEGTGRRLGGVGPIMGPVRAFGCEQIRNAAGNLGWKGSGPTQSTPTPRAHHVVLWPELPVRGTATSSTAAGGLSAVRWQKPRREKMTHFRRGRRVLSAMQQSGSDTTAMRLRVHVSSIHVRAAAPWHFRRCRLRQLL